MGTVYIIVCLERKLVYFETARCYTMYMKARIAKDAKVFTDIPNIGPAVAKRLLLLGLHEPKDLKGKDAFALYTKTCRLSGRREDPCLLDTYMAAVDFMDGAIARNWFMYTKSRKKKYPNI